MAKLDVPVAHYLALAKMNHGGIHCQKCMTLWFGMSTHTRQLALDVFQNHASTRDTCSLEGKHYAIQELTFYLHNEFCEHWLAACFPSTYSL
jgi:hypothetical protein